MLAVSTGNAMLPSSSAADVLRQLSLQFGKGSENLLDLLKQDPTVTPDGSGATPLPGAAAHDITRMLSLSEEQQLEFLQRLSSFQVNLSSLGSLGASLGADAGSFLPRLLTGEQQKTLLGALPATFPQLVVPPLNVSTNLALVPGASTAPGQPTSTGNAASESARPSGPPSPPAAAAAQPPARNGSLGPRPASMSSGDLLENLTAGLAGCSSAFSFPLLHGLTSLPSLPPNLAALLPPANQLAPGAPPVPPRPAALPRDASPPGSLAERTYKTRAATGRLPPTATVCERTWSTDDASKDGDAGMGDDGGEDDTPFASFVPGAGGNDGGGTYGGSDDHEMGDGPGGRNKGGRKKAPEIDWRSVTDPDERRRLRRMAKNRRTAAASRERKRAVVDGLQGQVDGLRVENARLRSDKSRLVAELAAVRGTADAATKELAMLREVVAQFSRVAQGAGLLSGMHCRAEQPARK